MRILGKAFSNRRGEVRKLALGFTAMSAAGLFLWATTGQALGVAAPVSQAAGPQGGGTQATVSGQAATEVKSLLTVAAARAVAKTAALRDGTVQESGVEGLVNKEGNRFYVGVLPIVQGTTGALQLAVENRSDRKVLAKVEVAGLPATVAVNIVALSARSDLNVVRLGPSTFLVELKGGLTGTTPNVEVQWTPGLATAPASYPLQVSIQAIEG